VRGPTASSTRCCCCFPLQLASLSPRIARSTAYFGRFCLEKVANHSATGSTNYTIERMQPPVLEPLPAAPPGFHGRLVHCTPEQLDSAEFCTALGDAWREGASLLLLRGAGELTASSLVELTRYFGEPESMATTKMVPGWSDPESLPPEIMVVSNHNPMHSRGDATVEIEGGKIIADPEAVTFPARRGWHTDQSYRRPPPDGSCFYMVSDPTLWGGDTLFADGTLAFDALPPDDQALALATAGVHAGDSCARTWDHARTATEMGLAEYRAALAANPTEFRARPDLAQVEEVLTGIPQPLARIHPETGKPAIYMCEKGQMDWFDGPIVGLPAGVGGEAEEIIFRMASHTTAPEYVYRHRWRKHDLLVWDNRCLMHAATEYDVEKHRRLHWRTTFQGNPGPEYSAQQENPTPWLPDSNGHGRTDGGGGLGEARSFSNEFHAEQVGAVSRGAKPKL
jgi:taurine dioxygenase